MLWFDSCIFALTFWKAVQVRREVAGGLLVTIFRDGMCSPSFHVRRYSC